LANEPTWVEADGLIQLNRKIVGDTGEPHLIRSRDLLESALDRPRNHWRYDQVNDVATLAVVLFLAVARNHPFAQGNKRTAFAAMVAFLGANGYRLALHDSSANADRLIAVLERQVSEQDLVEMIRAALRIT
jgi:death on curing protein